MASTVGEEWYWVRLFWGIALNCLIILFWVPLIFVMPPGEDYRPMCTGLLSFAYIIFGIINAISVRTKDMTNLKHIKIGNRAIIINLMPIVLFIVINVILVRRGNIWSP